MNKHCTVTVFLITENEPVKILLVYHNKYKVWMPPGGHQETWENAIEAGIREVFEETGIDITDHLPKIEKVDNRVDRIPVPDYLLEERIPAYKDEPEHYHLDQVYILKVNYQKPPLSEDIVRWFTKEELKSIGMLKNIRIYLEKNL